MNNVHLIIQPPICAHELFGTNRFQNIKGFPQGWCLYLYPMIVPFTPFHRSQMFAEKSNLTPTAFNTCYLCTNTHRLLKYKYQYCTNNKSHDFVKKIYILFSTPSNLFIDEKFENRTGLDSWEVRRSRSKFSLDFVLVRLLPTSNALLIIVHVVCVCLCIAIRLWWYQVYRVKCFCISNPDRFVFHIQIAFLIYDFVNHSGVLWSIWYNNNFNYRNVALHLVKHNPHFS